MTKLDKLLQYADMLCYNPETIQMSLDYDDNAIVEFENLDITDSEAVLCFCEHYAR